ncbi:hypothetical protein LXL04_025041 [Taraxacum kok-saghyz]
MSDRVRGPSPWSTIKRTDSGPSPWSESESVVRRAIKQPLRQTECDTCIIKGLERWYVRLSPFFNRSSAIPKSGVEEFRFFNTEQKGEHNPIISREGTNPNMRTQSGSSNRNTFSPSFLQSLQSRTQFTNHLIVSLTASGNLDGNKEKNSLGSKGVSNFMISRLFTTPLLLCSFISLSLFSSASLIDSAAGSRRLLRAITTGGDQPDFAVDLNVTNFDEVLRDTPAPFAIVEFFAHWCPACRNYKPQYEKVARLFNGANAIHPGIVLMTRVDCGIKVNTNLCDKFSISHYPSLFWGPTSKFVGGSWDGKNEKGEIRYIEDGRTSDRLLKWINTQTESSYNLEDEKYENAELLQSNTSSHGQIPRAISDVEEATSLAF